MRFELDIDDFFRDRCTWKDKVGFPVRENAGITADTYMRRWMFLSLKARGERQIQPYDIDKP